MAKKKAEESDRVPRRTSVNSEGCFEPFSIEFHYHLREKEHIFILKGSATLILGRRTYV